MRITLFFLFLFGYSLAQGQAGYQPGNMVTNLSFQKVLNRSVGTSSLSQLKGKITILDFFATWCVPCIKALPRLTALQQSNPDVKVVLVSTEEETRLTSFLSKRTDFPFPLVVDERESITTLFQPPSLPYTVVLDENGKVLAVTEVAEINDAKLSQWLSGKGEEMTAPELPLNKRVSLPSSTSNMKSENSTVALSQDFLYAAKAGNEAEQFTGRLKTLDYHQLQTSLSTDEEKKAFWINLYNAYTQFFLRQNPEQYKERGAFFKARVINVAGRRFSLDDIEHGILRHSKIKWSLGHLNKVFAGKTEKELRVDKLDYRLHFALNCGAKSCPPIAFYSPEKLDQQLKIATKSYLLSEVQVKEKENTAYLPAIMGWFRADFGGKKGMRKLLQKHGFAGISSSTKIRFKSYDWNLYLDNYKNL